MTLSFEQVADGALFGAHARFDAGCSLVVAASALPLATLIALAAGVQAPARGRVTLSGADIYATPSARQHIGSLLASETLPAERTVETALSRVLAARGDSVPASELLRSLGLQAWSERALSDLDAAERRSLALGLALGHERARVLALFEPFATTHGLAPELVRERILERAQAGCVVLIATTSYDVARSLGGVMFQLDAGLLRPAVAPLGPIAAPCLLTVRTPDPERLVAAISSDPAVAAARHDLGVTPRTAYLHGHDLEALALALGRAAITHALVIDGIAPTTVAPAPTADHAATTASGHAAQPAADARPADQSVSMPTAFADPTRPSDQSVSMPSSFAEPVLPPPKDGDA